MLDSTGGRLTEFLNEKNNNLKKEIAIPEGFSVIGSAGRFSIVKGLEYFIKAVPSVLRRNDKVIFLLIGYGKEELRLRQIAKDLKVFLTVILIIKKFNFIIGSQY